MCRGAGAAAGRGGRRCHGVVVIPREVEERVVALAIEKVSGENLTRDALRDGESLANVFQRFGIL